jgi:DNA-binding NarL/FixJ family response regulator
VIKVLLADREEIVRSDLRAPLDRAADTTVVAECDHEAQVGELARAHQPHVVLLEMKMGTAYGMTTLRTLRGATAPPAVAMLTDAGTADHLGEAVRIGARGFLRRETGAARLLTAVRDLARGGAVLAPGVAAGVLSGIAEDERAAAPAKHLLRLLSCREREVLALLGTGMSNAEIGRSLHLSEATVKGYVSAVLAKVSAENRVQAALVAFRGGLVNA